MSSFPSTTIARTSRPERRLAARQGSTTTSILYECPSDRSAAIETIVVCNTTGSAVTVRIHHTIPRETAGVGNAIAYGLSCAANTTTAVEIPLYLGPGDRIEFYASTGSAATFIVYGREAAI